MTHIQNLDFIVRNGIHCPNSSVKNPDFKPIGFSTLIEKRGRKPVKVPPHGVLNDFIPFYFSYKMPMLHKIFKGEVPEYSGSQSEIIYLVSSIEKISELGIQYFFTDRHAYLDLAHHYSDLQDLKKLNLELIKDENWMHEYSAEKKEFKQAEFLVYQHVPFQAIEGIVVHNPKIAQLARQILANNSVALTVAERPSYYFS